VPERKPRDRICLSLKAKEPAGSRRLQSVISGVLVPVFELDSVELQAKNAFSFGVFRPQARASLLLSGGDAGRAFDREWLTESNTENKT